MNAKARYEQRRKALEQDRKDIPLYTLRLQHADGGAFCTGAANPTQALDLLAQMRRDSAWNMADAALLMRCPNCGGLGFNQGGKPDADDIPCGWCQSQGWIQTDF